MTRPTAAALLLVALAGCAPSPTGEAVGIVVDVQGDLDEIERFTVLVDGERLDFETAPGGDYAFPVTHLRDHLRSGEPVRVGWDEEEGRRVATFLADG